MKTNERNRLAGGQAGYALDCKANLVKFEINNLAPRDSPDKTSTKREPDNGKNARFGGFCHG
jgi:hypothetical protein